MTYTITATRGRKSESFTVPHTEGAGPTIEAVLGILDRAVDPSPRGRLWATGHIVMTDEAGNIVHEMEAKP